jgi:hypothetical protein
MERVYAQGQPLGGTIGGANLGPFGTFSGDGAAAFTQITRVISNIIGIITVCASIWFLFNFVIGGLGWISAGGDKNKINESRDRMTYAFIGLLVVVAGVAILALAGQFLGFDTIITDPAGLVGNMQF